MIRAFSFLLLYQLVGEALVRITGLPIPGPVIGMIFLLLALMIRGRADEDIKKGSGLLLQHLPLFFVPAGVGVMVHISRIASEWLPITLALVFSTFAGMAVTIWVLKAMTGKRAEGKTP